MSAFNPNWTKKEIDRMVRFWVVCWTIALSAIALVVFL